MLKMSSCFSALFRFKSNFLPFYFLHLIAFSLFPLSLSQFRLLCVAQSTFHATFTSTHVHTYTTVQSAIDATNTSTYPTTDIPTFASSIVATLTTTNKTAFTTTYFKANNATNRFLFLHGSLL